MFTYDHSNIGYDASNTSLGLMLHKSGKQDYERGIRGGISLCKALELAISEQDQTISPRELYLREHVGWLMNASPYLKEAFEKVGEMKSKLERVLKGQELSDEEHKETREYFTEISHEMLRLSEVDELITKTLAKKWGC